MMKRLLIALSVILLAGVITSCSPPVEKLYPSFQMYVREDLGFVIEYPKDWQLEEFNDSEFGLKPKDDAGAEIQIGAFRGSPFLKTVLPDEATPIIEASLQVFVNSLDGSGLTMISNGPVPVGTSEWDWIARFFYYQEGLPVGGAYYIRETETMSYSLVYISSTKPPEADKVIASFRVLE